MLEARSLTKYYNHTAAVRDVSFVVQPGEILGYLGPNGAGKSTTVKMLTGLIEPRDGQIFYQGRSVHEDVTAFQRRIGYVPEEAHLYPHLSGREYLQLAGRLRGLPRRVLEPKMDEFLRLFSLWNDRHAPLSSYSKGMRQKILLSAALLHNPDVLILDEPFSGLDVTSALVLRSLLRRLAEQGKTILYSSHVLEVVEKVCSKVLILRKGEVVAYDSIHRLRELMSQPSLEGVFAQLTEVEDSDALADEILDVMTSGSSSTGPLERERPVTIGLRLYRGLAGAFPHEFQNVYGEELLQVSETAIEPIWRRHGVLGLARLLLDIAIRVPIEYFAEFQQDVRYSWRTLLKSPGFAVVAWLSLSLGICIATSAYSELHGLILRDLPVPKPEQLVAVQMPTSYPNYKRYSERGSLFSSTLAYVAPVPFEISIGRQKDRKWGHVVTGSYFSTLGVSPELGRFFEKEDEATHAPVVVISDRFWQDSLRSDPLAIGKMLQINGASFTVIGVGPKGFLGASPIIYGADLWAPVWVGGQIVPELGDNAIERPERAMFHVVGRMQPNVVVSEVESALDTVARQVERDYGDPKRNDKGRRVLLVAGGKQLPIREQDLPLFTEFFTVLGGMVLLIACSNLANMMLARATDRRKEIAVRLSLGASRARLIRQLLTESMLLAFGAGVAGFCLSVWLMRGASQLRIPYPMPVLLDLTPDVSALAFTFGLVLFAGLALGLVPAWQSTRADVTPALKEGGTVQLRRFRKLNLRTVLVLSQVAGSLALLLLTGFLVLGNQTTLGLSVGFNPKNLYLMALDPIRDGYTGEQATVFFKNLLDRVKRLPAASAVCLTDTVPLAINGNARVTFSDARVADSSSRSIHNADKYVVGKDYFETLNIPVVLGRGFRAEDELEKATAVVVSEELVTRFWKGEEAIGRSIEVSKGAVDPGWGLWPGTFDHRTGPLADAQQVFQVVGVVKNVARGFGMEKPAPAVYFPLRPSDYTQPSFQGMTLIVRGALGVDAIAAVRREITSMDASVAPFNVRSMADQINQTLFAVRIEVWTYGVIGVFGVILSLVGLAGMTAYSVTQRFREIGIRMALGARKIDVLGLIMKQAAVLVGIGTVVGLAAAWAGMRTLAAVFSSVARSGGVTAYGPTLLIGAPILLALFALIACYLPARRSMHIDPAVTLRQE
jgi:predicted permease